MKNKLSNTLIFVGSLLSTITNADGILGEQVQYTWKPVIGIGGGVSVTTNLGRGQHFPIQDPVTDEFYTYSPTHQNQTRGLLELFLGAEHSIRSNWLFQGGIAYNQTGSYQAGGSFVQGADAGSSDRYTYQYNVVVRELLAQAKLMRPWHDHFYPYVLGGVGASFNKTSTYSTTVPPFLTFTREYANNTSNAYAYKIGVGVDMDIVQHARLGLAYRFSGLGSVGLGSANIDTTRVSGTLSQPSLYNNEVLLQLTYVI